MSQQRKRSFVFGISAPDYNFIGRQKEIARLKANMESGVNTILISPRRWGKTSLVDHVRGMLSDDIICVALDIFACKSEYEFYNLLAEAVLKQTASHTEQILETIKEFLVRLTPKISYTPSGTDEFSISLGITPENYKPEEILDLAEKIAVRRGKHIVVCIDEFQQIGEMPDSLYLQRSLRAVWQHQQNVSYCLYGSKKHLMNTLFHNYDMPFYKFGDTMFLQTIPLNDWQSYISTHFEDVGRHIDNDLIKSLCEAVDFNSSYVQQLAWFVLLQLKEGESATEFNLTVAKEDLLEANDLLFMQNIQSLSVYQLNFLRALADGIHSGFGDQSIRRTYNLGSPSNIGRLKESLSDKDLIDIYGNEVSLVDPVFAWWIKKLRR